MIGTSDGKGMAALEAEAASWSSLQISHLVRLLAITDNFSVLGWGIVAAYEWIDNVEPLGRHIARFSGRDFYYFTCIFIIFLIQRLSFCNFLFLKVVEGI